MRRCQILHGLNGSLLVSRKTSETCFFARGVCPFGTAFPNILWEIISVAIIMNDYIVLWRCLAQGRVKFPPLGRIECSMTRGIDNGAISHRLFRGFSFFFYNRTVRDHLLLCGLSFRLFIFPFGKHYLLGEM